MKPFITSLLVLLLCCTLSGKAQEQQIVPYTLADRDRAIRTEVKMEALDSKVDTKFAALETKMDTKFMAMDTKFAAMDTKFEAVNSRIDYIFWLLGVIVTLILFILGYTIWDRRTALKPALDKADSANYKSTNLTNALREYAQKHPDLANILKTHGLL
jgi:hypothetical protein